jgi:hypothetical protein
VVEIRKKLEEALRKSGGRAVILVHPLFHEFNKTSYPQEVFPERTPQGRKFLQTVNKVISKSRVPVIVFEEHHHFKQAQEMLPKKVFFVKTFRGHPIPLEGWAPALSYLKEAGLKQAIVGGQLLVDVDESLIPKTQSDVRDEFDERKEVFKSMLSSSKQLKSMPLGGCVAMTAAQLLKAGVKVAVMRNAVHPSKPELKKGN